MKQDLGKSWRKMNISELKEEFLKCKNDEAYFIKKYVKVEHQLLGLINFDLFPFQERIVSKLNEHRFTLLNKFRQAGCTTIACAHALYICCFDRNKTIALLSMGDTESKEVLARIKVMYEELPPFLRPKLKKGGYNEHNMALANGCKVKARPAKKTSGRSLASYLLIIDEAAFIENIATIWAAVYPVISTGGRVLVLSTVNGMGNWYHTMYEEATHKRNDFNVIDIHWKEHPQYFHNPDYEHLYVELKKKDPSYDVTTFEETTKRNIGLKRWRQEFEKEFLGTGETYFDGDTLKILYENINKNFTTKYNNRMRVWKEPDSFNEYVMGVDVSLGRDRDYSAFIILNAYNGEQVGEFYSNKTTIDEFSKIIATEGRFYNNCKVLPERNSIGNNLISNLYNLEEYENLWLDEKGELGIQVTTSNSEVLLVDMEEAVRNKLVKINSERTVKELLTFIITENGKPEADESQNDDLVTALKLAIKALKELLAKSPTLITTLNNKSKEPMNMFSGNKAEERKMFCGNTLEDAKWLLGK